ncbi:hypothetical protein M917_2399 [Psychrobacter aquaticus CMS 56]|uniref:Uncharacterized protein n=1 Tax=Psychrobacter aquaticus CMS 56 TaxID=1354303 RepID=U4T9B2_9GAMM|nr:hypothetical protein M917_2399 [Psychrobacter aquaticus CMS 56]
MVALCGMSEDKGLLLLNPACLLIQPQCEHRLTDCHYQKQSHKP